MKSKFNKLIVIFMALVLSFSFLGVAGSAADTATVSADSVSSGESSILVPVNISSSTKIMGFKVNVSFESDELKIKGVSRGSVTAKGNFNTSYGVFESKFDVIWNNTTEVDANGTLFVLTLDTSNVTKDCEVKISFSQPDTFNEAYEDVVLQCAPIKIVAKAEAATEEATTEAVQGTTSANSETTVGTSEGGEAIPETTQPTYDNSQIADSVNNALDNMGYDSIYDVPAEDREELVNSVNNNLNIILGTDHTYYTDFNDVFNTYEGYYSDGFVADAIMGADAPEIKDIIDSALKEVGADSIADVKDKGKFIKLVETKIQGINPDAKAISEYISEDLAMQTITKLYNTSQNTVDAFVNTPGESVEEGKNLRTDGLWIIALGPVLCITAALIIFAFKKQLRKKK